MKKLLGYLLFFAMPFAAMAQDCAKMYDYFKQGVKLEYTHYDKKGKIESVGTQEVTRIYKSVDTLVAVFAMTSVDEKGKEMYQNSFPVKCHAGTVFIDMRSVVPPQQNNEKSPDMQIEVQGTDQTFPPNMKPGQLLPDAEMEITMRLGTMMVMNTRYVIKNRKVEAEETITTTAGTYKCLKISYDFEYKLLGTRTIHTLYWYSPAVGMVQSISYDKKGKEESRMVLTKFVK